MTILGIETSCDETAAGVIAVDTKTHHVTLLANIVASSLHLHAQTGGIIPETAAREQIKYIIPVMQEALEKASITKESLDAVAVTYGPGLVGSLLVGIETAKVLSYLWNKPIIPVNHMYGHIYANFIDKKINDQVIFPAIVLVVSGGHTDLLLMKSHSDITVLGGTRDDAAGECFDKCARLLGYPYPGGPKIAQFAQKSVGTPMTLPRPMLHDGSYDFSFSGLKTAFLNLAKQHFSILRTDPTAKIGWKQVMLEHELSEKDKQVLYAMCQALEDAIVDVLVTKTLQASEAYDAKSILLSGGVAANEKLRSTFEQRTENKTLQRQLLAPPKNLCTDNGAMIATAAYFHHTKQPWHAITVDPELYY